MCGHKCAGNREGATYFLVFPEVGIYPFVFLKTCVVISYHPILSFRLEAYDVWVSALNFSPKSRPKTWLWPIPIGLPVPGRPELSGEHIVVKAVALELSSSGSPSSYSSILLPHSVTSVSSSVKTRIAILTSHECAELK